MNRRVCPVFGMSHCSNAKIHREAFFIAVAPNRSFLDLVVTCAAGFDANTSLGVPSFLAFIALAASEAAAALLCHSAISLAPFVSTATLV